MKKETQNFKIRNRARAAKVKRLWLAFGLLIPFLLMWVGQTVRSTQLSYQIQTLEDEFKKERARQIELQMLRDRLISLDSIEKTARNKLGLIVPSKENIVLVTLPRKER